MVVGVVVTKVIGFALITTHLCINQLVLQIIALECNDILLKPQMTTATSIAMYTPFKSLLFLTVMTGDVAVFKFRKYLTFAA